MADPTTITTPAMIPNPLSDFQKIGYNTFLYTPDTYTPPNTPLILIFSWMAAAAKHIAKYTVAYRRLFPNARIVLVRNWMPDVMRASPAAQKLLIPAFDVVREHVASGGEILVHSFSNGGGMHLLNFAKLWKAQTGGEMMPMRAQIMDSAPGKGGWKRSHAAMYLSLPPNWFFRLFGSVLIHSLLAWAFVRQTLMRKENPMVIMGRALNETTLFDVKTPRVYLYSRADAMVGDDEVEEHADEAEAAGKRVVKVRFENSPHAGHIREDERRYWGAVMEAWERGPK